MKKILIINHYAGAPEYGMEFRHYDIAKELVKKGFEVSIVASSFTHLRKEPKKYVEDIHGVKFIWIKTPKYKTYGIGRLINMLVFAFKLLFLDFTNLIKPDTIIVSSPSPFPIINAIKIKKKFNAKLIYEIRDVWPKSIIDLNKTSPRHPLMKLIDWLDNKAIEKSDIILSPLSNISKYIEEKGYCKKIVILPNGISSFEENYNYPNIDNRDEFIIGYGGTVGDSNSILNLIEAAVILKERKDILFKIVGDGSRYDDLNKKILDNKLSNVKVYGRLSHDKMLSVLKECNILYKGNPKKEIYQYGISAIKMVEYLLLKKPIIDASYGVNIVNEAGCGIEVPHEDPKMLAKGILKMKNLTEEDRVSMGEKGFRYVIDHYLYKNSIKKLIEVL